MPAAMAGRLVSVGYTAPSNLQGLEIVTRVPRLHLAEVRVPSAQAERTLRARPGIRFVQRTVARVRTAAPPLPLASARRDWQWGATHADAVPAWVTAAAAGVTVAVVDTGADMSISQLAARSPVTWNVTTSTTDVDDVVGHGTFVASLAAGFGGDAKLMIVQANRGGTGFSDVDEAAAITWAVDHGARIVNLSIGGRQTSRAERDAITYATSHGVLLVAAAGNLGAEGNPLVYPAALIGRSGLVVGASTTTGARAPFSTTGRFVDVLAPGVDVLGALAGGTASGFFTPVGEGLGTGSGTSYAAPEVAGAAALVWAANPLLDATGVAETIEASASGAGHWTSDLAFGNLDVAAAVQNAAGGVPPQLAPLPAAAKGKHPKKR